MAQTQTRTGTKRGKTADKDIVTRLADAGEEALHRIVGLPGGHRVVEAVQVLRDRLDELQDRLRSLDPLERRVAQLEQRLEALEGKRKPPARKAATKAK